MKKLIVFCFAMLFVFSISSCKEAEKDLDSDAVTAPSVGGESTRAETTAKPPSPQEKFDINPLTGEYNIVKGAGTRPVGFMISNINLNGKQPGIHNADFYFDTETEGGISRIMAVFSGVERVPDKIGPVRSARSPFITVADSIGAVYVHYGGEPYVRDRIKGTTISDIDGMFGATYVFKRDSAFRAPNDVVISKAEVKQVCDKKNYSTANSVKSLFEFGGEALLEGEKGENLQVYISGAAKASFKYDETTKKYIKHLGDLSSGAAHISYEGKKIETSTVVVIYAKRYNEGSHNMHTNFELKSGSGLVLNGGKSVKVRWQLSSGGFRFTDQSGAKLTLPAGNVYMCVTGTGNEAKTILK